MTEPKFSARIILGIKLPKNMEKYLQAQKDPEHQALWKAYLEETDPELKAQKWQAVKANRVKLGIGDPEEE